MRDDPDGYEVLPVYRQILAATDRLLRFRGHARESWFEGGAERDAMANELHELGKLMKQIPDATFERYPKVHLGGLREYGDAPGSYTPWGLIDEQLPLLREVLTLKTSSDGHHGHARSSSATDDWPLC